MNYNAKDAQVASVQLKTQRLVLPFTIVGNAVAANVAQKPDDPAILFLRNAAVDNITVASGALDSADVATYAQAAVDATGIFNALIRINEFIVKVCSAQLVKRVPATASDTYQLVALGNANGVVQNASANGTKIMLTADCDVDFTGANTLDAAFLVEYIVQE